MLGKADPSRDTSMMPAAPASNPESACVAWTTKLTGTPESSAARGFAPVASIQRPKVVPL
jgi:hypothetical protein